MHSPVLVLTGTRAGTGTPAEVRSGLAQSGGGLMARSAECRSAGSRLDNYYAREARKTASPAVTMANYFGGMNDRATAQYERDHAEALDIDGTNRAAS
jgi:hypothetical protein